MGGPIAAVLLLLVVPLAVSSSAVAQPLNARERAEPPYAAGLEHMRLEAFDAAAEAFEAAVTIDPSFDMAYYMLGRAHLARKQYAAAVYALVKCRNLHQAETTRVFANMQESERLRRERIQDLDRLISGLQLLPQTFRIQEQIRQLEERKRQLQDLDRARGLETTKAVPAFVSLSLGSAYFRSGNLAEAEKAYLAAIAADPKTGEAHNNLAVVYMETGRLDEAEKSVRAAETTGLRVDPALKDEIKRRRKRWDDLA
jgi:Tfp pilus assembly protein PilF